MKKRKNNNGVFIVILTFTLLGATGCSSKLAQNPFGIGYEHSACESAAKGGVCGSPENIYKYKNLIQQTQEDYRESGYNKELFFGISPKGNMLVKDNRVGKWERYEGSKIEKEIKTLIAKKEAKMDAYRKGAPLPNTIKKPGIFSKPNNSKTVIANARSIGAKKTDLEVVYKKQNSAILETRTNVGQVIRDSGKVRKVWIAPVEDYAHDFVSAHEIYVVVRDPKWIVGEKTPQNINRTNIPTSKTIIPSNIQSKDFGIKFQNKKDFSSVIKYENDAENLPVLKKTSAEEELIKSFIE